MTPTTPSGKIYLHDRPGNRICRMRQNHPPKINVDCRCKRKGTPEYSTSMNASQASKKTADKPASRQAKTCIALTNLPLRVNLIKRGSLGDDLDKERGNWLVETDFHRTGQIKNGPEAHIAELDSDDSASGFDGFNYRIGHEKAKLLAQIFAGSPALLKAARNVTSATAKEPKFKHAETYAALTELMAAIEAIENGSLIFNPLA